MPAAADHLASVRQRMLQALIRRRIASWLVPLLPVAALAAAIVAGAFGAAKTLTLTAPLVLAAAVMLWGAIDLAFWRKRVEEQLPSWLNDAVPELEDSSAILAAAPNTPLGELQRNRLLARIEQALDDERLRGIANQKARFNAIPLALAVVAAAAAWAYAAAHSPQYAPPTGAGPAAQAGIAAAGISLHAEPPSYTGVKPSEGVPRDLQIPQHSKVRWCAVNADAVIELGDGQNLQAAAGRCAEWTASDSIFWRSRHNASQRYTIRVTPDQAPQVAIAAPNESVSVLKPDAQSAQVNVSVSDDYAIVKATLHMTLARGSGENIRFTDKEAPLPVSSDPRKRSWNKQWMLKELGMEPGDELYFFVRASDNAPVPHISQSPTYTLRLPGQQGEALESTALPSMVKPENLRSQRQIIIDTEQLVADSPRLGTADLRARSEKIAGDQAKLRLRYGQFLGEESSCSAMKNTATAMVMSTAAPVPRARVVSARVMLPPSSATPMTRKATPPSSIRPPRKSCAAHCGRCGTPKSSFAPLHPNRPCRRSTKRLGRSRNCSRRNASTCTAQPSCRRPSRKKSA